MADCPKCGRTLFPGGDCPKCGATSSRSKWYAIAEEGKDEDAAEQAKPAATRKPSSTARSNWYEAAGVEVPADQPGTQSDPDEFADPNKGLLQVSQGRRDPPIKLIAIIAGTAVLLGLIFYASNKMGKSDEDAAPPVSLPEKNIQHNRSYGFRVVPPEGFKQQVVRPPDFVQGVHGELTAMVSFRDAAAQVDAYYFGEVKKDTTLEQYAAVAIEGLGTATPVPAIPGGMSKYPAKGFLIDMGTRKALFYVAFAKPDRFLSLYALAPSESFAKAQGQVEAAARAFEIVQPDGPHPGMQFAPATPEE